MKLSRMAGCLNNITYIYLKCIRMAVREDYICPDVTLMLRVTGCRCSPHEIESFLLCGEIISFLEIRKKTLTVLLVYGCNSLRVVCGKFHPVWRYTGMHARMHVCTYARTYVRTHACRYACTYACLSMEFPTKLADYPTHRSLERLLCRGPPSGGNPGGCYSTVQHTHTHIDISFYNI